MKTPNETEIYGFIGWVGSSVVLVVYFLWVLVPDQVLRSMGIVYFPNKYWAMAIPAYIVMLVLFIQVIYQGLNMYYAAPLNSLACIEDRHTRRLQNEMKECGGIDDISDIELRVVNQIMYSNKVGRVKTL